MAAPTLGDTPATHGNEPPIIDDARLPPPIIDDVLLHPSPLADSHWII